MDPVIIILSLIALVILLAFCLATAAAMLAAMRNKGQERFEHWPFRAEVPPEAEEWFKDPDRHDLARHE